MGSSLNKDQHAKLFVTLDKRINFAGSMVTGAVHIVCTENRPVYQHLNLRIQGYEHVYWQERHGKHTYHYQNQRQSYLQDFGLAKFASGLYIGHYTFPFSFLLPGNIPGSFQLDNSNYIRYHLWAVLPDFTDHGNDQAFKIPFHIREPPKNGLNPLRGSTISQSNCCGCCCSGGMCELHLETNATHVEYGKTFMAKGRVDTSRSEIPIKDYKIALMEFTKRVSRQGHVRQGSREILLYDALKDIPIGQNGDFETEVHIPADLIGHTAVGNIISRFYYLQLIAEVNACYSNPRLLILSTFVSTHEPDWTEEEAQKPPEGWNPTVAPMKVISQLPQYHYQPSPAVLPMDTQGSLPPNMSTEMGTMGGNYPEVSNMQFN